MNHTGELLHERFEILREIGEGGQGKTYLARDVVQNSEVALKELNLSFAADWKAIELFERESNALQSLDHPSIPSYVDAFHDEEGRRFFLVQQFIDGESLSQRLERGEIMGDVEALNFIDEMLNTLDYLHGFSPPVIHRDIKPSNILLDSQGNYALIDFGAVQVVSQDTVGGSTIVGTSGYMPPEQLMGRATAATDLYALAATTVHLITGLHPSDLPMERMKLQFRDVVGFSSPLLDVLDKMLEPDVERRFSSVAQVRQALRDPSTMALIPGAAAATGLQAREPRGTARPDRRRLDPDLANRIAASPFPNPVCDVKVDGDRLILEAHSEGVGTGQAAIMTGGIGLVLSALGCLSGFGELCCLGIPVLFLGTPLVAMSWDRMVSPRMERLVISPQGVEITTSNSNPKAGITVDGEQINIPLSSLRNHYLNIADPTSGYQGSAGRTNLSKKSEIVFVEDRGHQHGFGSTVATRGKFIQAGAANNQELRWLYDLVDTKIQELVKPQRIQADSPPSDDEPFKPLDPAEPADNLPRNDAW